MQFSLKKMVLKGMKVFVVFLLPFLVDKFLVNYPEVAQLSVGAVLYMLLNWLKVGVGMRLP